MDCSNITVIPQYSGTCWFNAILMVSLYSQYTRKAVIKASKTWNKNDSFLMVLKEILKIYKKEPEKVKNFFYKIKPENILLKLLKKNNDRQFINEIKTTLISEHFSLGYNCHKFNYIPKFLNFIKIKTLDIFYNKENNNLILNFNKYHKYSKKNFL